MFCLSTALCTLAALSATVVTAGEHSLASFIDLDVDGFTFVQTAPSHLAARHVGDLQCNIARVNISGSVFQALVTAKNLTTQLVKYASTFLANPRQLTIS